jgi:uncharacterized protein YcbX
MTDPAIIDAIYRYPVKGLSPQKLPRVALTAGLTLPADRLYAIENGPTGFDPAAPAYFPKTRFLMLMRNERLAALKTDYDDASHTLTIVHEGREAVRADLRTKEGRLAVEAYFRKFMPAELSGPPKVLSGEGAPGSPHSFSDVAKKVVSIINLASVAALETAVGQPVDPLRFRANLYVRGWPAWHEFEQLDREIHVGNKVRLKVVKRIVRCAATNVDPVTAARDLNIPKTLMQTFDHMDCGIYAEVIEGGEIATGDTLKVNALV